MARILNLSEGVSIAVHTMLFLAINKDRSVLSSEIKNTLNTSDSYLAKILQRLVKLGYIESLRGTNGGYRLRANADEVKLIDIYEAIEGPFKLKNDSYETHICKDKCALEELANKVDKLFIESFSQSLSDLVNNHSRI